MFLIAIYFQTRDHYIVVRREDTLEKAVSLAEEYTNEGNQAIVMVRYSEGYRVLWPEKLVLGTEGE